MHTLMAGAAVEYAHTYWQQGKQQQKTYDMLKKKAAKQPVLMHVNRTIDR